MVNSTAHSDESVRRYYDNADVDAFYDTVWGGEDLHVGIYAHPDEDVADASHRTVRHAGDTVADLLGPGSTVLDLGSGYGGSSRALARRFGCRVLAVDLSEEHNARHRAANARLGLDGLIEVVTGTLDAVPAGAGPFDVVWSLEVLCHLPDRAQALEQATGLLRPGGALVFSDIMSAEGTPPEVLRPAISRLGLPDLATPSSYRAALTALALDDVRFEERTPDLVTHYTRLDEEVRRRVTELEKVITPAYLDGLLANLPLWTDLARRNHLRWGLFHGRRAAEG
ncbi:class I SAM-dependent methyltransferase [Streptomyces sp. HNM0574]|uniref:SAM-dependent methyltransferase n=1 Tax=Streptomyces sp. HNM0574 TaxID=2714954 RepID=UPI00146AF8AC|nr:class I SAM-dependent methyltransferase [Streptomyces sp. HNM0574]NLU67777.1 methyltransferase domain-containing protein [Streptomyces sp. HNM0574]